MKAKLDEIEKVRVIHARRIRVHNYSSQQFVQFSPRALKSEFAEVDQSSPRSLNHKQTRSRSSMTSSISSFSPSKLLKRSSKRSSKAYESPLLIQ